MNLLHTLALAFLLAGGAVFAQANQAPVANDDNYTTNWDSGLQVEGGGVLANDSDPDGDTLEAHLFNQPERGHVTLYRNGNFTYQPEPGYEGTVVFRYKAWDGRTYTIGNVTIDVNPGNRAPVANDDYYQTDWDTPLTISAPGLLANDSDPDGDGLETHVWAYPERGHLILYRNGGFYYRPEPGYEGDVTFQYKAWDGRYRSIATVTLSISSGNHAPIANDDIFYVNCDERTVIEAPGVMGNDSDPNGDPMITRLTTGPEVGHLGFHEDGSFWYEPPAGFQGSVTFVYKLVDQPADDSSGSDSGPGGILDTGDSDDNDDDGGISAGDTVTTPTGPRGGSRRGKVIFPSATSKAGKAAYDDFATVTLVVTCPDSYCPESAYLDSYGGWGGGHAFYLPGGIGKDFHFDPGATFIQNGDGTAVLSGTIRREAYPNRSFEVVVHFSGYSETPPPGSPKREMSDHAYVENGGPIDVSHYVYYETFGGILTGTGEFAGTTVLINRRGPTFQIGEGADGKNVNFGGSGWFDWSITEVGSYNFSNLSGVGDINIDLTHCPAP